MIHSLVVLTLAAGLVCAKTTDKVETTPKRIAALAPSIVQTLVDIGLEDRIACAAGPLSGIPLEREVMRVGLYHKPNMELIIKCQPDLVITTYAGTPPETHRKLRAMGYKVIMERPASLGSIRDFIMRMSDMFHIKRPGILKDFDSACIKNTGTSAVMIVGLNPVFAAGSETFVSDAMKCSGYLNLLTGGYKRMSIEKIISMDPQRVIVAMERPEGSRDYAMLKKLFGKRIIKIDPKIILEPSTSILKGISELREKNMSDE